MQMIHPVYTLATSCLNVMNLLLFQNHSAETINVNESHKESNLNFCVNNNKCQYILMAEGKIC